MNAKVRAGLRASLFLIGFWAYGSALSGTWLWDDDQYVTQNPLLRSGSGFWKLWTSPEGVNYFPLTDSVRWVEWQLWGNAPFGYHLVNVVTHLIGSLLVWRLAARLASAARDFRPDPASHARWAPWAAGLLFAVHPLCVESVAWVSELKNTLGLIPLLMAGCALVQFDQFRRRSDYYRALAYYVAAMLCKSTAAAFPLVILLYIAWRQRRVGRADLRIVAPFLVVALALGSLTLSFETHRAIGAYAPPVEGLVERVEAAGLSTVFYLWKCLCPQGLMPIYPRWQVGTPSIAHLLPWPLLLAAASLCWFSRVRWARTALFVLGSFVAGLLPVLGLVPMAYLRLSWVADHFAYIALVSVVIGVPAALECAAGGRRVLQLSSQALVLCTCVLLAAETRAYSAIFASPEALWTYTTEHNPSAWNAWNELAVIRCDQGRFPEAIACFRKTLALRPDFPEAHNDLGVALADSGHPGEAIGEYRSALALRPAYASAHCNLGNALLTLGRAPEAVPEYLEALRLNPRMAEAHYNLGLAWRVLGHASEADEQFQQAAALGLRP